MSIENNEVVETVETNKETNGESQQFNYDELLQKYESLLKEKTNDKVQKNIAKNLVGEDNAEELINKYNEKSKKEIETLTNELNTLKKTLRDKDAKEEINKAAAALSENGLKAFMRLNADTSFLFDKNDKIIGGKAEEAIKNFLVEFPEFAKVTKNETTQDKKQEEFHIFSTAPKQTQANTSENKTITNEELFAKGFRWSNYK